jgi:hypothetical protein
MSKRQKRKLIQKLSGVIMISGFLTVLGATGLSDLNLISDIELTIRGCIGCCLLGLGYVGLKATGWRHIL